MNAILTILVVVILVGCSTHHQSSNSIAEQAPQKSKPSTSAWSAFGWSFNEVTRATSPSGRIDAVLVESNGGATTSFGYDVYLVTKAKVISGNDDPVAKFYGAVRSENAYGVDLHWNSDDRLTCEYLRAEAANIVSNKVTIADIHVVVTLHSNVSNMAAPSGGMFYNLKKR